MRLLVLTRSSNRLSNMASMLFAPRWAYGFGGFGGGSIAISSSLLKSAMVTVMDGVQGAG